LESVISGGQWESVVFIKNPTLTEFYVDYIDLWAVLATQAQLWDQM
jgi:hypothetical protein